jgi:hypothetical protein
MPLTMRAIPSVSSSIPANVQNHTGLELGFQQSGAKRNREAVAASTIDPVISFGFIVKRGRILAQRRGARRVEKAKKSRAHHSTEIVEEPEKASAREGFPGFLRRQLASVDFALFNTPLDLIVGLEARRRA